MAYWNPFGWDEETRRGIQSVVRPIMQVASVAASAGAFSGGSAAASTTPDAATAAGADFDQPSTAIPTDPNDMGTLKEWTTDQDINAPSTPIETPGAPQPTTMQVPSAGTTTGSGLIDPSLQQGGLDNQYFKGSEMIIPENATPFQDVAQAEGLVVEQVPQQAEQVSPLVKTIEARSTEAMNALETGGDPNKVLDKYPVSPEPGVKPKPSQTTTQQPGKAKPPTTETPGKPPATKTPNNEPPKPDGKGPGGNKDKNPLEDGFTWENIQKFLASDEGKKWMLSDKGLMGIGRRLSAAADAGVGGGSRLSAAERKKIKDKLKKYRESIRKRKDDE